MILSIGLIKKTSNMQEIISQLKYDIWQIEKKLKSIENTKFKMEQWKGKPIYKSCEESIEIWKREIEEHKQMFFDYSDKLKNI